MVPCVAAWRGWGVVAEGGWGGVWQEGWVMVMSGWSRWQLVKCGVQMRGT